MEKKWLYTGKVMHKRLGKTTHAFCYPAMFLCFPLSARPQLANAAFGYNRFNLLSFHDRDHGNGVDGELWARSILADHGLTEITDGEIWLQTQPRVLGFVFNPVSFWYCLDRQQHLRAVICEVSNTFGERHCYLLTPPRRGVIDSGCELQCEKIFHVSPFFPVKGQYRFRFHQQADTRTVAISYWLEEQLLLKTLITGNGVALTPANILSTLARLGWTTGLVVLRIHWQALKLWRKGAIFHRKPAPPSMEISS